MTQIYDPPPFEVFAGRRELASYCDPILNITVVRLT